MQKRGIKQFVPRFLFDTKASKGIAPCKLREDCMKKSTCVVLAILTFGVLCISCTMQQPAKPEIPDLTGVWLGRGEAVIYGDMHHRDDAEEVTFTSGMQFTLTINEQKGNVFHGTRATESYSEDIVGCISADNTTIFIADHDGYMQGSIQPDGTLNLVYLESGLDARIAALNVFVKQE